MNVTDSLNSIPILFLAVSCNFTGDLLSRENQKLFTNNVYVKHFILYMILLITIVYTNRKNFIVGELEQKNFNIQLLTLLAYSLFIYLIFILSTKMQFIYIALALIILFVHVFISEYRKNEIDSKNEKELKKYRNIEIILEVFLGIIVVLGVGTYFFKQKREHKENFVLTKFLFGTSKS